MSGLPDPNLLTREPGRPSAGGDGGEITPEQAVEEARQARETAERERDQARAREQEAARQRDEAQRRATDAGSQAWTAQETAVEQSIAAQNEIIKQARTAIATAQAAGDHEATADAFDHLAEARATLRDLGNRKAWIAQQKTQQPPPQAQSQAQESGVEVRTPGGSMRVTPQVKAWVDDHPRFANDPTYYNFAIAAAQTATADGIHEGTPAYFRHINSELAKFEQYEAAQRGDQADPQSMNQPRNPAPSQRRASSTGAPVSRSSAPIRDTNGAIDPLRVAQRIGQNVTVDDLREMGRINGYMKDLRDEAGFQRYLQAHEEIHQIERAGGDTGLRSDQVYR